MTVDDRVTVSLGDVLAVHIECLKCHTAISFPVTEWNPRLAFNCPACNQTWWEGQSAAEALRSFAHGLRNYRGNGNGDVFRIGLQVPRPAT